MNTKISIHQPKPQKLIIFISLIIIALPFFVDLFFREEQYGVISHYMITLTEKFQKLFSEEQTRESFLKIMNNINTLKLMVLIVICVYNFSNVYKSFILFMIITVGNLIAAYIKFIYVQEPPYYHTDLIKVYYCGLGWGLPATQILISTTFYLTLWKIICLRIKQMVIQTVLLVFIILFILLLGFSTIIEGSFFFNQVLFSMLLGTGIYLLLFEGIRINLTDGKQFFNLIRRKIWIYFFIEVVLILPLLILFLIDTIKDPPEDNNNYTYYVCQGDLEKDNTYFNATKLTTPKDKRNFSYETSFLLLAFFLPSFFCVIAVKMELRYMFKDVYENWFQFNFSNEDNSLESDEVSLMASISITKDTKWNNTKWTYSIVRLIVLLIMWGIASIPYMYISESHSLAVVFFVKITLSFSLFALGGFFGFKFLFLKTTCINGTLLSMIQEK